MTRVLIAEDEQSIAELIKYSLEKAGYIAEYEANGEKAFSRILIDKPDLVILDLMLPELDGLEICRLIRQNENVKMLPIIILTAKGEEIDRIVGLEVGADDYITKPFSPRELVARVKALLRRIKGLQQQENESENIIIRGNLVIYPERYEAFLDGVTLDLTPKEFKLLQFLAANEGNFIKRERILKYIWGYDYFGETRTVDVHIRHLRQKIENNTGIVHIETMRGFGYRLKV